MKELEYLLENYWIPKERDKELYYSIKDSIPAFRNFLSEKLGYSIIINPDVIKLEKLPGKAEEWMGISEFENIMEYAFLCILLMFLEDKGKDEQFVLSQVTEFIQGNYDGEEKVDWTLYRHRRHLIKVLRFAADIGIISVDDGEEKDFVSSAETEVLYESTGLSRYLVRNFTTSILNYTSYREIENEEWGEADTDRGIVRRHRVYRRLLMSPVVYNEGSEDADYDYIKKQRSMIANDLEAFLGYDLHVHRNGALVVLNDDKYLKDTFPCGKAISDVVLLFSSLITEYIKNKELILDAYDSAVVSRAYFDNLVEILKSEYSYGWSKEYRDMSLSVLEEEIISYMKGFNMLEILKDGREIKFFPLVGKVIGTYPQDFAEAAIDKGGA
ncbi:TIGR02678 family protein [Clostridium oryzae]|uniref:TIGR02678 family protein n=1 Tax=Clostridium oryzae TaxID=1450648 RepID=A0A1V4ILR4_9CLOT|nr:TIGR02678 family protein [Clostridium oryzae]OPJ60962.1 hypothetical protein CLORY_25100 [Clostridium oryzae]